MVCAGVWSGLLLFSLLLSGIRGKQMKEPKEPKEPKTLDEKTLVPAIKFLRDNYNPGPNRQFAIAFNAPEQKCADYLDNNFLEKHPAQRVKEKMNGSGRLYEGPKMIAARPKPIPGTEFNQHSEYLLLKVPSVQKSPMKKLLNKDKTGCVVFYTYNSPCTSTCTNPYDCYRILDALKMFKEHKGKKAFVFTKVWKNDCDVDISTNLKAVLKQVPLYRCDDDKCVACKYNKVEDCMN